MKRERVKLIHDSQDKVSFFVDKEKNIVICKLETQQWVAEDRIMKYAKYAEPRDCSWYAIPAVYYGRAKCAPEDTFDVEVGKKIALDKAKAKRRKAINKALELYKQDLLKDIELIDKYCFSK